MYINWIIFNIKFSLEENEQMLHFNDNKHKSLYNSINEREISIQNIPLTLNELDISINSVINEGKLIFNLIYSSIWNVFQL